MLPFTKDRDQPQKPSSLSDNTILTKRQTHTKRWNRHSIGANCYCRHVRDGHNDATASRASETGEPKRQPSAMIGRRPLDRLRSTAIAAPRPKRSTAAYEAPHLWMSAPHAPMVYLSSWMRVSFAVSCDPIF